LVATVTIPTGTSNVGSASILEQISKPAFVPSPEGAWDPTKIPRIQDSMSEVGSLLSLAGDALSQLDT
jgi:hypothetical protein